MTVCETDNKNWSASGCALGNACTGFDVGNKYGKGIAPSGGGCGISGGYAAGYGKGYGPILPANENGAITAGGWNGYPVYTVGSVADIPVDSIVALSIMRSDGRRL